MRSTDFWIRGGTLVLLAVALLIPTLVATADAPGYHQASPDLNDGSFVDGWLAGFETWVWSIFGAEERTPELDPNGQPAGSGEGDGSTSGGSDGVNVPADLSVSDGASFLRSP